MRTPLLQPAAAPVAVASRAPDAPAQAFAHARTRAQAHAQADVPADVRLRMPAEPARGITVTLGMAKPSPVLPVRVAPVADLTPPETRRRAQAEAEAAAAIAAEAAESGIELPASGLAAPAPPVATTPATPALKPLINHHEMAATGPDEQPLVYRSPGIVVRRAAPVDPAVQASISLPQEKPLAELSPAAGAPGSDTPLIALPQAPLPPEPEDPAPVMPAETAASAVQDVKPPPPAPPVPPQQVIEKTEPPAVAAALPAAAVSGADMTVPSAAQEVPAAEAPPEPAPGRKLPRTAAKSGGKDKKPAGSGRQDASAAAEKTAKETPHRPQAEPVLSVPVTAQRPAPPTAPPPVLLPAARRMPPQTETAAAKGAPTPLLAQPAIRPDDRAVTPVVLPPMAAGNVPYYAIRRWEQSAPPLAPPVTAAAAPVPAVPVTAAPATTAPVMLAAPPAALAAPPPEPAPAAAPPAPTPEDPARPLPPSLADASEPRREISQESREILHRLPEPAAAKKPRPVSEELALLRGKNAAEEPPPAAEARPGAVTSDALGIKIEVKAQRLNLDYELEKAYNALVAGNSDAAGGIYRNVLESDPGNKNALFGLATIYHRAGQLEKARPLYAQLLTVDPNNRDGLNNFLVLLADEAPEDALTHLERLREANPDFSPIPAQIAVICQKLNMTDKAIANMTRAIELAPENLAYRYNFAIMLDKQRKYDEAAVLYRQILQAYQRGDKVPGNIQQIQQRLTFISSNRN